MLAAEPRNVSQPNRPRRSGQRSKSLLIKPEQPICINSIVRWRSRSVLISRRDSENRQSFLFVLFRIEPAATRRKVMSFCVERAIPLSVKVTFADLKWFKGMHDFQTDATAVAKLLILSVRTHHEYGRRGCAAQTSVRWPRRRERRGLSQNADKDRRWCRSVRNARHRAEW